MVFLSWAQVKVPYHCMNSHFRKLTPAVPGNVFPPAIIICDIKSSTCANDKTKCVYDL